MVSDTTVALYDLAMMRRSYEDQWCAGLLAFGCSHVQHLAGIWIGSGAAAIAASEAVKEVEEQSWLRSACRSGVSARYRQRSVGYAHRVGELKGSQRATVDHRHAEQSAFSVLHARKCR